MVLMTINLKKAFTLTFFDHRLFPFPAFSRFFSLAANALHLHRNSLLYRINKIEEITNSSLKEYKTFLHLIVSFYMLNAEE